MSKEKGTKHQKKHHLPFPQDTGKDQQQQQHLEFDLSSGAVRKTQVPKGEEQGGNNHLCVSSR